VGLANTRERLAHLYGAAHEFTVSAQPGVGLSVMIVLPLRLARAAAERRTA
jgi:sensor histidine kinase YesM